MGENQRIRSTLWTFVGPRSLWACGTTPPTSFRFFHGINTWNGDHYQINKLPGDNAWCSNLETRTFGCESEMDNDCITLFAESMPTLLRPLRLPPRKPLCLTRGIPPEPRGRD